MVRQVRRELSLVTTVCATVCKSKGLSFREARQVRITLQTRT
jgi:hypothetical protein